MENKHGKHRTDRRRRKRIHVPLEMWLEILSRLPIKPLAICTVVCKKWRYIVFNLRKKFEVPNCGLFLRFAPNTQDLVGYFCFKTKKFINIPKSCAIDGYVDAINSGYDKGLLTNLSFNLGPLFKINPSNPNRQGTFFTFYRGLLLLGLYDGTYEVHNVATNQVYTVPKSPIVTRYGSKTDCSRAGAIIKLRSKNRVCRFLVVRFSLEYRKYEVYYSEDGTWVGFGLEGYNFNAAHKLLTDNYAVILMESNIYIYLLTNGNHGVRFAIFGPKTNHKITYHTFSLPKLLNRKHLSKKLWICDKTLHLSYYDIGTLCIWKVGEEIQRRGATSASWVWIRKLVITNTLELSILPFIKTNAQKYLAKAFDVGHSVVPVTCLRDAPVIFLLVNSTTIYAYNYAIDLLDKIGDIKDYDNISCVSIFEPCFSSFPTHGS